MSYNRCKCGKCGSNFATVITTDDELKNEPCPNCGEKNLCIVGPMSVQEVSGLFSGG
jgi:DNA-directed RNA polymerase subunit RPC12/RpoP